MPDPTVLEAEVLLIQRDALRAALEKVLDTREKEAKAMFAWQTAVDNFSGGSMLECDAHSRAMTAASNAEKEARLLLATLRD